MKEVEDFWKKISSNEKKHNEKAEWITRKEERTKRHCTKRMDIYQTETVPICNKEIPQPEIRRNWQTAKFWLNVLTTAHLKLTKIIWDYEKPTTNSAVAIKRHDLSTTGNTRQIIQRITNQLHDYPHHTNY